MKPRRISSRCCIARLPEAFHTGEAQLNRLQAAQITLLQAVDGKPISEIAVASPFAPGKTYNLYSCFSILPRHQHRHLWQAEQIWGA